MYWHAGSWFDLLPFECVSSNQFILLWVNGKKETVALCLGIFRAVYLCHSRRPEQIKYAKLFIPSPFISLPLSAVPLLTPHPPFSSEAVRTVWKVRAHLLLFLMSWWGRDSWRVCTSSSIRSLELCSHCALGDVQTFQSLLHASFRSSLTQTRACYI